MFAPNFKHRKRIVPRRPTPIDAVQLPAPMMWMRRFERVFAIDIDTCPECGDKLRVIAGIDDPPLIAKILSQFRRHEPLLDSTPRAPPGSPPLLNLT